jgi:hypothetical protein
MILSAVGTSTRAIRPTAHLSDGPAATKAWAMSEKIVELFSAKALAGDLPNYSLWRMTSNAFYFTVYVSPQFAQSATDAPKAGLF